MAEPTQYTVHTKHGKSFRRAGIVFTPEPQTVDASKLTPEQLRELLATDVLNVVPVGTPAPVAQPSTLETADTVPETGRTRRSR